MLPENRHNKLTVSSHPNTWLPCIPPEDINVLRKGLLV